ncbi:trypsin-like serine protease [Corallococcus aberystwythensis]|uniref:Peptidase S1 n=1 Tax=Corallococcus aberystwythensis TaxID=2316722 RepID=A0A3A8R5J4_9BACT|nr:trypsin-like serine protease [Corallococcus aberystwythensis]RKH74460.1 peptidase S1 [Corallococcus aberystwythensis]
MPSSRSYLLSSPSLRAAVALGFLSLGTGCGPEAPSAPSAVSQAAQPLVGGTAATAGEFPWMVSLQDTAGNHLCGGTLLNSLWVLTSRQCVRGSTTVTPPHPSTLRVAAGSNSLALMGITGQVRTVLDIIPFPGSWDAAQGKDAALLRLGSPLTLDGVTVAALPVATAADVAAGYTHPGVIATLAGWGQTAPGGGTTDALMKMSVPLVSNADAALALGQPVMSDQLGADGSAQGNAFCTGDVGGPLVVDGASGKKLVGVASYNLGCSAPDIFERAAYLQPFIANMTPRLKYSPRVTLSYVTAPQGGWKHYSLTLPSGIPAFTVALQGGTGNGTLYVRADAPPTLTNYACRSGGTDSNVEYCSLFYPVMGTWYVSVYGETAVTAASMLGRTFY